MVVDWLDGFVGTLGPRAGSEDLAEFRQAVMPDPRDTQGHCVANLSSDTQLHPCTPLWADGTDRKTNCRVGHR